MSEPCRKAPIELHRSTVLAFAALPSLPGAPRSLLDGLLSPLTGLQTQSATHPVYAGPFDAMKKIFTQYGIAGIYKGQVVTLWREATGYGIYFWAYEKLMQREMQRKGIRRDQVNPANAVLFGAAAGYAVSSDSFLRRLPRPHAIVLGRSTRVFHFARSLTHRVLPFVSV